MKNPFDKIYVVSMISNNTRQKFITSQMKELGLEFEFVYGVDFNNFTNDAVNKPIKYPDVYNDMKQPTPANYGCTITHYMAVRQAYEFEYKNVLIIEDDICFIKDIKLFEECINSIPEDADFVTWDPRFIGNKPLERSRAKTMLGENQDKNYVNLPNDILGMCGGMMYALMSHEVMHLYINNQHLSLTMSDRVQGFFSNPTCNRYMCTKCLCTDQFNIFRGFKHFVPWYWNLYEMRDKSIKVDNFFYPEIYHISNREPAMQDPRYGTI